MISNQSRGNQSRTKSGSFGKHGTSADDEMEKELSDDSKNLNKNLKKLKSFGAPKLAKDWNSLTDQLFVSIE